MNNLNAELKNSGLLVENPLLDGAIKRCATENNPKGKNGWYIGWQKTFSGKEFICCSIGDWTKGDEALSVYKSWQNDDNLSPFFREEIQKHQAALQKKAAAEKAKRHLQAAQNATKEWESLSEFVTSQYLAEKGVNPYGVRYGEDKDGGYLAVPVRDFQGNLKSLQRIYDVKPVWANDRKFFLAGGEKKGLFHFIGKEIHPSKPICFTEGYATAASIHEATGYLVVVCFDAGNIEPVVKTWREQYPTQPFLICADNDQFKPQNTGVEKATAAAKAFNCAVAIPDFSGFDTTTKPTDFNDLHALAGLNHLKLCLMNSTSNAPAAKEVLLTLVKSEDKKRLENSQQSTTHNAILDESDRPKTVDLLQFIDDSHLLKRLSLEVANAFHLPQSTVFLMGMAVFSSVSCRKFAVNYQDNKNALPIGLYAIAEQPSGVGKSRCLNVFQAKFSEIHKAISQERKKQINHLLKDKELAGGELNETQQEQLFDLQNSKMPQLFTTNATPEGLERTLADNKGMFAAISSEQGLFNSLFGKTYSNGANNNDVVLNGFDAGFINVNRAGRDGYSGNVTGAVVCFAQQGSVETILDASQGTGLSERFLMLVEPHKLGTRDHSKTNQLSERLVLEYEAFCDFALEVFSQPTDYNELSRLFVTTDGFKLIADYQNTIEPHLADSGKYSFPALRGVASKINMQIMKLAANLHLLDGGFFRPYIDDKHIRAAIQIADRLLQHQLKMMRDKGIIGIKAEWQAILSLFESNNAPLTYRQIIQARYQTKPFKDTQSPSEAIKKTLDELSQADLLESFEIVGDNGKAKTLYRLGQ